MSYEIANGLCLCRTQESDMMTLKQFPPKHLDQLVAQRDVLLEYAKSFPVGALRHQMQIWCFPPC